MSEVYPGWSENAVNGVPIPPTPAPEPDWQQIAGRLVDFIREVEYETAGPRFTDRAGWHPRAHTLTLIYDQALEKSRDQG